MIYTKKHCQKRDSKFTILKNNKMNRLLQLIVLILALTPGLKAQDGKVIDQIIAVIGDKIILQSELESQVVSARSQGILVDEATKCQMFEEILYQKLLLNQADIDSVVVSDAQVEGELERRLSYFISQIGSEKKLEAYYKKSMFEIKEEFRRLVREQLVSQMMQQKVSADVKVTPKEVKAYYNSLSQDSIPLIKSEVEVAQILIQAKESKAEKDAARERINGIRERILKGESFSTLAVLYSEDEGSSKKGGELGFMGRAELVPEFSVVAFKLKGSKVSEIVETKFGFHIIQLIERRGQKMNARHILIKIKVGEEQIKIAKNLADSVYKLLETDTLTFGELALKFSDDEQTKKSNGLMVNRQTGTSVFEIDQIDPQIYYSVEKLQKGEVSKPVPAQEAGGKKGYRIIKLISKTESHKANLEADYSKIQNAALATKKNEANNTWIKGKVSQTYVKIIDDYKSCVFENSWIK